MIVFDKVLRLDNGSRFKLYEQGGNITVYFTAKGSAKKTEITADGFLNRVETVSYCDEAFPITGGTIYRIRNNLVIK